MSEQAEYLSEAHIVKDIANSPLGIHEALHTAHLALNFFADNVADHPVVHTREDLTELAVAASEKLWAVYQAIGTLSFDQRKSLP